MKSKKINNLSPNTLKEMLRFDTTLGIEAHLKMAPPYRAKLIEENIKNQISEPRVACVLILLYKQNNQWMFPAILRNKYKGVHSNQIGLPGGKTESFDLNLEATAKRETNEEINADIKSIDIVGKLSKIYIPPSNFIVHPFVGIYKSSPHNFAPCDKEVKRIIPINLIDFIHLKKETYITDKNKPVPAYKLSNELYIWGATAMMLCEFKEIIKNSLDL